MAGQDGSASQQVSGRFQLDNFVADLVQLRRDAGQPSLRKMAETAHYSHTALSSVLSGARLPSLELTMAFVRACRGDEDAWRARWHRENALIHGTGAGPQRGVVASGVVASGVGPAETPTAFSTDPPPPAAGRHWRSRWAVIATAGLTALATAAVVVLISGFGSPVEQRGGDDLESSPAASPAVADGADPQENNCQLDAVNAKTVQVPEQDRTRPPYGNLTLRYSPRCQAAWPLFVTTERVPTGVTIRLVATRPSDGAVSRFDYPFMVSSQVYSVFGNVLRTTKGCVSVAVEISAADNRGLLASGETPCARLGDSAG